MYNALERRLASQVLELYPKSQCCTLRYKTKSRHRASRGCGCLQFLGIDGGTSARSLRAQNQLRDKHALTTDAIHVQQDLMQEAVGLQDQVSAAYGGFNRTNFHTDGSVEVNRCGRLRAGWRIWSSFRRSPPKELKMTPHKTRELNMMLRSTFLCHHQIPKLRCETMHYPTAWQPTT
jgi:hypothetical protein